MPLQAHREGPQTAQTQVGLLRSRADAERDARALDVWGARAVAVAAPSIASAWPTMYFVAAWMDTSTPIVNGLK